MVFFVAFVRQRERSRLSTLLPYKARQIFLQDACVAHFILRFVLSPFPPLAFFLLPLFFTYSVPL